MGFLDKLFGKKAIGTPVNSAASKEDDVERIRPAKPQPVQGPPSFVRAVELQKAYWTHNSAEQAELEARGFDQLSWRERLRLHHLICMQRMSEGERETTNEKCRQSIRRLTAPESPYRRRGAMVWQGRQAQLDNERKPDLTGEFLNPSLTHIGCLEFFRVDINNHPIELDFVSFEHLASVFFAPPSLIRGAKLIFGDGGDEIVLVPMIYGLTWSYGNEADRSGQMTRFAAHLDGENIGGPGAAGIGLGQQDFALLNREGNCSLFGLGSVAQIYFTLDIHDPHFDGKARARGIDPDEIRKRMEEAAKAAEDQE